MPYILPTPAARPNTADYLGRGTGKILDLLLQAYLAGKVGNIGSLAPKNIPNPGYGQTGSPGTQLSQPPPGLLTPPQNPQQIKQGFVPRTPASPYASQRMINPQQLGTLKDLQSLQTQQAQTALMNKRASQPPIDLKSLMGSQGGENTSIYQVGDVIDRDGKEYEIVGFDTDGTPLVEER